MADLNKLFKEYNDKITLSSTKKTNLTRGRDALRDKVKEYFKEKEKNIPKFHGQGSYMMKTMVNPLPENEYDLDDGIYLTEYDGVEEEKWPTTTTVHTWIKKAVENHTSEPVRDKNTCIRVTYANDYHIDLPSYIIKDDKAYLAHKSKGWFVSDPKAFTDWFVDKVKNNDEQLRRCVKYLKAWKDYQKDQGESLDLCGLAITILVANNYSYSKDRDDKALLGTVKNILNELEDDFVCYKPVDPTDENLFDGFSETKKTNIFDALKDLKTALNCAVNHQSELEASNLIRAELGDRFPKGKDKTTEDKAKNDSFIKASAPAIIKSDNRSA